MDAKPQRGDMQTPGRAELSARLCLRHKQLQGRAQAATNEQRGIPTTATVTTTMLTRLAAPCSSSWLAWRASEQLHAMHWPHCAGSDGLIGLGRCEPKAPAPLFPTAGHASGSAYGLLMACVACFSAGDSRDRGQRGMFSPVSYLVHTLRCERRWLAIGPN